MAPFWFDCPLKGVLESNGSGFYLQQSTDPVNPQCQLSTITIRLLGEFGNTDEEIKSLLQLTPKERHRSCRLSGKEESVTTCQKIQKTTLPEWQGLNLSFSHSTFKVSLSSYSHFWGERLSCQELFFTLLENVFSNWQKNHFVRRLHNTSTQCFKLKACFHFKLISISTFSKCSNVKKTSAGSQVQTEMAKTTQIILQS